MKRLQKYATLLAAVKVADPKTRVGILRTAPDEFIKTLLEVVLNFLAGNIPHTTSDFQKLRRHKATLRQLSAKRRNSVSKIRKQIIAKQQGGFLPLLIAPALAAATPFIAKVAARKATEGALDGVTNRVKGFLKKV